MSNQCPKCGADFDQPHTMSSQGGSEYQCGTVCTGDGTIYEGMRCLRRQLAFAAFRAEQAEAIVARLPKTADGVPVVPGINLYCAGSDREWVSDCIAFDRGRPTITMNPEFLYSTRAAADAAQTKPDDWARDHRLDSHGKVQP